MRKILLILTCLPLTVFAQQKKKLSPPVTLEDKVKNAVKKHLSLTLNDWKSYEPVEWSAIIPVLTDYEETAEYHVMYQRYLENSKIKENLRPQMGYLIKLWGDSVVKHNNLYKGIRDSFHNANFLMARADSIMHADRKIFKPELKYYKVLHSFRAKNQYGALSINRDEFHVTPDFEVLESIDLFH